MPFIRQGHKEKPLIYGSFQDRQYSIWRNLEDIYRVDHESETLIMPLFWGLPCWDYSKFRNYAANYGTTYKNGNLNFDGDNDNINLGSIASGHSLMLNGSDVTISAWINQMSGGDDWQRIVDKSTAGAGLNGYALYLHPVDRTIGLSCDANSYGSTYQGGSNDYEFNTLIHVVGIITDSDYYIYKDSQRIVSGFYSGHSAIQPPLATTNMRIGTWDHSTGREFNGIMPELRIENVARVAEQIALFHDRPWDLYRRVGSPIYSLPISSSSSSQSISSESVSSSISVSISISNSSESISLSVSSSSESASASDSQSISISISESTSSSSESISSSQSISVSISESFSSSSESISVSSSISASLSSSSQSISISSSISQSISSSSISVSASASGSLSQSISFSSESISSSSSSSQSIFLGEAREIFKIEPLQTAFKIEPLQTAFKI